MTHGALASPTAERRQAMTFEQFLAEVPDGVRAEWVDGEVIHFMVADLRHQDWAYFLVTLLRVYATRFKLGAVYGAATGMRTIPGRSFREPDVVFVAAAHRDRLTRVWIEGGADLVVEIVSDDSLHRDQVEKRAEYAAVGIPEYWVFDAREGHDGADFYRLGPSGVYEAQGLDAEGRYHSRVVPGFWLDPAWLRQDPLPAEWDLIAGMVPDR